MAPKKKKKRLQSPSVKATVFRNGKRKTSTLFLSDMAPTCQDSSTTVKRNEPAAQPLEELPIISESLQNIQNVASSSNPTNEMQGQNTQNYYYQYKQKELEGWQQNRVKFVNNLFEHEAPIQTQCAICNEVTDNPVRCCDCGPTYIACNTCAVKDHILRPLHYLEVWETDHFDFYDDGTLPELQHPAHTNCSFFCQFLTLVDYKGRMRDAFIRVCSCDDLSSHLIKLGFWPSTPVHATMAFKLDFMKLMKAMLLESQTSSRAFIDAHRFLNDISWPEANKMYRMIVGASVEEYRHAMAEFEARVQPAVKSKCPACPKENPVISIDANFGLVRKASSGRSFEGSKHPAKFFISSEEVANFKKTYNDASSTKQSCNTFKAGEALRAKHKTKKLDVKGVFGSVCRHEIPILFLDITEGERLVYPVFLIQRLLESFGTLRVTYDIACKLDAHLKRHSPNLKEYLRLAIPIFHCYGHKRSCQIAYNPRRVGCFGLTDGEGIERLWGTFRRIAPISKEMTPVNRDSLHNEVLWHILCKKVEKIPLTIFLRYKNVKHSTSTTRTKLQEICQSYNLEYTPHEIQKQLERESIHAKHQEKEDAPVTWMESYIEILEDLHLASVSLENLDGDNEATKTVLERKILCLTKKASKVERQHGINRWNPESHEYADTKRIVNNRQRRDCLLELLELAKERTFLCMTKKKYPEGQSNMIRLANQINNVMRKIQQLLIRYNELAERKLTVTEVINPEDNCYKLFDQTATGLPHSVRMTFIDLHFRLRASEEELVLLEAEAKQFCATLKEEIDHLMTINVTSDQFGIGYASAIFRKTKMLYTYAQALFTTIPNVLIAPLGEAYDKTPPQEGRLDKSNLEEIIQRANADDVLDNEMEDENEMESIVIQI